MKTLDLIFFIWFMIAAILNWIVFVWKERWDCMILGVICYFISMFFRRDYVLLNKKKNVKIRKTTDDAYQRDSDR